MTTYSVSKSLLTSTPRVLLGRSLTCPSEASTEKPFPRYFWMVFALAGDSTMTKPFDNGSSYFLEYGFEASTNGRKATSYWAKAIGSWLLAFGSWLLALGFWLLAHNRYAAEGLLTLTESADSILMTLSRFSFSTA